MSLKPSRRGLLVGMGATAADAVLPVQGTTRDDPMALARRESWLKRWQRAECRRVNWSIARSPA